MEDGLNVIIGLCVLFVVAFFMSHILRVLMTLSALVILALIVIVYLPSNPQELTQKKSTSPPASTIPVPEQQLKPDSEPPIVIDQSLSDEDIEIIRGSNGERIVRKKQQSIIAPPQGDSPQKVNIDQGVSRPRPRPRVAPSPEPPAAPRSRTSYKATTGCVVKEYLHDHHIVVVNFYSEEANAINRVNKLKTLGFSSAYHIYLPCYKTRIADDRQLYVVVLGRPYQSLSSANIKLGVYRQEAAKQGIDLTKSSKVLKVDRKD